MADVRCFYCSKKFSRPTNKFNENIKFKHNFYCSRACQAKVLKRRAQLICGNAKCRKSFERVQSEIENNNYCSRHCAAVVNNQKFPKKTRDLRTCQFCDAQYKIANKMYCSADCHKRSRKRDPEVLLKLLRSIYQNLGRVPAKREATEIESSCVNLFGSWNKAIIKAGLTPNRSHDHRMYKRVITKAADGHLCDSISEVLIDNWLTKNQISHDRDGRYPASNHRADWVLKNGTYVEYFGLAKDSPRYDRDIQIKKELCAKYGIELIEVYPQDLYPKQKLELKISVSR